MLLVLLHSILVTHCTTIRAVRRSTIAASSIGREGKLQFRSGPTRWTWSSGAGNSSRGLSILVCTILEVDEIRMILQLFFDCFLASALYFC